MNRSVTAKKITVQKRDGVVEEWRPVVDGREVRHVSLPTPSDAVRWAQKKIADGTLIV